MLFGWIIIECRSVGKNTVLRVMKTHKVISFQSLTFSLWSPTAGCWVGFSSCVPLSFGASSPAIAEGVFSLSSERRGGSGAPGAVVSCASFFLGASTSDPNHIAVVETRKVPRKTGFSSNDFLGLLNWSNALKPEANVPM